MSAPPRATTSASSISRSFNNPLQAPLSRKKMSLQSVLQKGKAFLTPRNSSDSINQIKSYIFPTVDPAIDGEDCDHDCETCEVKLPKGWKIDTEEKLYGHVNGWATHMLVATGKTDWVKDVTDEKGSVMQAVRDCGAEPSNGVCQLESFSPLTFLCRVYTLIRCLYRSSCSQPPTCHSQATTTHQIHPTKNRQLSSSSPPSSTLTTSPLPLPPTL